MTKHQEQKLIDLVREVGMDDVLRGVQMYAGLKAGCGKSQGASKRWRKIQDVVWTCRVEIAKIGEGGW